MKRKIILFVALVLCGTLLLNGCGKTENSVEKENVEVSTSGNSGKSEKTVSFGLNQTVTHEGLCEMSELYAEVLDDKAITDGWYYYYTDTDQSPAKTIKWKLSEKDYTTVEVLFSVKNISDKPQKFGDKITANMFYQEKDGTQEYKYKGTAFQQNPGQVEEGGEEIMWSTKPVEINVGKSANVSFRFDIPKDVYEKIFAAANGEKTEIKERCEFTFGDGITYVIDLVKTVIPASKYDATNS